MLQCAVETVALDQRCDRDHGQGGERCRERYGVEGVSVLGFDLETTGAPDDTAVLIEVHVAVCHQAPAVNTAQYESVCVWTGLAQYTPKVTMKTAKASD